MTEAETLKDLLNFMAGKGFVWGPEPEIYGGMSGFYTYGPLGKLLKNNVEDAIREVFTRHELFEVECPIIMPKKVWEASGHLGGFTDPLIKCGKCKSNFRLDKLIEEKDPNLAVGVTSDEKLLAIVKEHDMKCPNCKGDLVHEVIKHDLMMGTTIGVDTEAYNRPETATTTYLPFPRFVEFFKQKLPFGVFQIGKAFRNEISPRQHLMRGREFTQAEGQIFLLPDQKHDFLKFKEEKEKKVPLWTEEAQKNNKEPEMFTIEEALNKKLVKSQAYAWTLHLAYVLFKGMGIPPERIRMRQHHEDEKAFYADDAWDVEVKTNSFGWYELCGIHDRSDYDLKQHAKFSGKELVARDEENNKVVPHVLEMAFGTDRPTFALLDIFYEKKDVKEGKSTFHIPIHLAPVKVAVLPLFNKEGMPEMAYEVQQSLLKDMVAIYDKSGSIGRRYLRNDEVGTPFCVTVDHDSVKDKDVTIRERGTGEQKRVKVEELKEKLNDLLSGELMFKDI